MISYKRLSCCVEDVDELMDCVGVSDVERITNKATYRHFKWKRRKSKKRKDGEVAYLLGFMDRW